jgi:putative flippase GtrA
MNIGQKFSKRKNILTDMRTLLRFALIGLVAVSTDFLSFQFLIKVAEVNATFSKTISFVLGALLAYYLNTQFTFKNSFQFRNFYRYALISLFSLFINLLIFQIFFRITHFSEISWVFATAFSASSNFILLRNWVYINE